jgi:hypothetical protein
MKTAVITLCVGDAYERLAKVTHPTIKAYADRIGAKFFILGPEDAPKGAPIGYAKLAIPRLFAEHNLDRAIFVDTDLIIRDDCPSLFDFVPVDYFGAFNEGDWMERKGALELGCEQFQVALREPNKWGTRYYNTGVMVFDRCHLSVFEGPTNGYHDNFYEQTWLNLQLNRKVRWEHIKNIGPQFNRMSHIDVENNKLDTRYENYIIHYAGTMAGAGYSPELEQGQPLETLIKKDLGVWGAMKKSKSGYHVRRKYVVSVGGGLGDQVDAEPVVREIRRLYPHDHLIVASHWPELFNNLDYEIDEVVDIRKYINPPDVVHAFHTYSDPTQSDAWKYMTHVFMHSTDFSSLHTIRRQLGPEKKLIQIKYTGEEAFSMREKLGIQSPIELVGAILIHPGRSWFTKTLDAKVWQEVIDTLARQHHKVIVIGKDGKYLGPNRGGDNIGLTSVKIPSNVIDARDKLTVKETLALIDASAVLVSNDSAPIHLAGATNTWVVGFFTAKHPDFVLPFRVNPETREISQRWRVVEVNSRPKCWPCNVDAVTTKPSEVRADHCLNFEERHACHPTAEDILRGVEKAISKNR